jgi:hypothetical protein
MKSKELPQVRQVPMEEWGKDHWSMLAYIETRCVDHDGTLEPKRVRCNPNRHPQHALPQHNPPGQLPGEAYPHTSRLREGVVPVPEHDDYDCFYDIQEANLLKDVGTGLYPRAQLTRAGIRLASELRVWKANGGVYAAFVPKS